jgi:hypothetical protein
MLPKKNTEETQIQDQDDQEQAKTAMTESVADTPTAPNSCQSPRSSVGLLYSNMTFGGSFSTSSPSKSVYGVDCGPQYSPITPPSSSSLAQVDSQRNKSFSPFLDNNLDNRCLWPADKKGGNNRYGFNFNGKTHERKDENDEWIEKLAAEPGETTRDREGKVPNMTNNVIGSSMTHRVIPEAHISEAQESTSTAPEPNKSKTRNGSASGPHKASRKKITRSARGRLDRSAKRSQN